MVFVDGGKNVTLVAKKFHGLSVGVKREEKCDAGTNAINEREKKPYFIPTHKTETIQIKLSRKFYI